jgi:Flp pilus assembly protein TadD
MINKFKLIKAFSFSLLAILAFQNVLNLNYQKTYKLGSSLSSNYPGLAPMTPSMNPNPGMYFPGNSPLPGQPYPQMPPPQMGMGMPMPNPMGMPPQQMGMGMPMPNPMGMPPQQMGMGGGNPASLDPNDPVTQALSLHQAGRYADAIQIYESIIINNPPDPRIYASIADAHFRLGNTERALKYAVEALKLDPNYSSGHLLLGTILGEMGDVTRAVRAYERVIALDQNNPYAYYNLGLLYYKKADIKVAIEYLERARDLNPNDPKIWNNLGVAYYDNGQFTKAGAAYSQALGMDPAYETARRNMELVRGKLPISGVSSSRGKRVIRHSGKRKAIKKKIVKSKK